MAGNKPKLSPQKIAARNSKLTKRVRANSAVPELPEEDELPPGATYAYAPDAGPVPPSESLRSRRSSAP